MIIIPKYKDEQVFALNEPDSENLKHAEDYIHVHSCGIMPEIMPENSSFFRPSGSPDYMLNFLSDGIVSYNSNLKEPFEYEEMHGGSVIIYKPNEPQYYTRVSPIVSNYWVHFLGYGAPDLLDQCKLNGARFFTIRNQQKIKQLFLDILKEAQSTDEYKEIKCNAYLLDLLSEISRQNDTNKNQFSNSLNDRLAPAIDVMLIHYSNDINMNELASLCNLSKFYFIRLFKEHIGLSPYAYLTQLRINNAKDLLEKTSLKISAIAESIGYNDPLYFSKVFKVHTNQTPIEYRKTVESIN